MSSSAKNNYYNKSMYCNTWNFKSENKISKEFRIRRQIIPLYELKNGSHHCEAVNMSFSAECKLELYGMNMSTDEGISEKQAWRKIYYFTFQNAIKRELNNINYRNYLSSVSTPSHRQELLPFSTSPLFQLCRSP